MNLSEIEEVLEEFLQTEEKYLWLLDPRILWDGLEDRFHADFKSNVADLLATQVRRYIEDPGWTWWSHLKAPTGAPPLSFGVAALLPLVRLSRKAAEVVIEGLGEGWSGHPEAVIPTLVNRAGLLIEDIGGSGSFTPSERLGLWYDERTWHWEGPVEFVPGKLSFPLPSKDHALPPDELGEQPCVAFLFLTRGELNHPEIWSEYLAEAGSPTRTFAHTKELESLAPESLLRIHQVPDRVETAWGDLSLVLATLSLLARALEDPETSHFVLLSESCVPVRPFRDLRENLRRDPRSRIRVYSPEGARLQRDPTKVRRLDRLDGISRKHAFFQDQWMCLNRGDAMLVSSRDHTNCFRHVFAPDECYFATVLAACGRTLPAGVANRPITWTEWRGGPHPMEHRKVSPRTVASISESGCFFARKFPAGSNIGIWGLHLATSESSNHGSFLFFPPVSTSPL
jgi:hypothetical protein